MKTLAALLVLVSVSAYAYTPLYDIGRTPENTVVLTITNDSEGFQTCSYNFSWVEGLSYKRFHGKLAMLPGEQKVVEVKNDIAVRIMHLRAHVDCE